MPVEMRQEGRRLLVGVIRGVLRKSELDAFQKAAADLIHRETTISCLIVLGSESLGSIDYALAHLRDSLKLLVVLAQLASGDGVRRSLGAS